MNGHGVECVQLNFVAESAISVQFVQMSVGFMRGTREPPS